ncbi:MAG: aldo/keto reductase [Myxococcota bacterium]|nr:aldo/keto reductase [Myxococcota bacterium]
MSANSVDVRGIPVPAILYGTAWKEDETERLVRLALAQGFVGIDTANQRKHYFEAGVGAAIAEHLAKQGRDALFLQTKFTYPRGQDHRLPYDVTASPAEQVRQSFARSLQHLGVTRIDSYVLHGPESARGITPSDLEVWRAMEALCDQGLVRLLGVSNVSAEQLEALARAARICPAFVQNRCYAARGWDADVRAVCRAHDAVYQGFSLLTANRAVWQHPRTAAIAERAGATPAQVIFAMARGLGMVPLTGTTDAQHMREDLRALAVPLSPAELAELTALG